MLTVAVPKRNKLQNIIVLTPKDGYVRHPAYGKTVAEMLEEVRENAQKE